MLYYKYTRPARNSHWYPDPTNMDDETFTLTETPFSKDRTFICYIDSSEPSLTGKLNSQSEFNWQKLSSLAKAVERCNDNIGHHEGEEFTDDGTYIVDNRTFSD